MCFIIYNHTAYIVYLWYYHITMLDCIWKTMFVTLHEELRQFFSYSFDYIQYFSNALILNRNHQLIFYFYCNTYKQRWVVMNIARKKAVKMLARSLFLVCWSNLNFYSWNPRQAYFNDINSNDLCSTENVYTNSHLTTWKAIRRWQSHSFL